MGYISTILGLLCAGLAVLVFLYRHRWCILQERQIEFRRQSDAVTDMLNVVGMKINTALDLDGALDTITEFVVKTTQSEAGAVFLLDNAGKTLQAHAVVGLFPPMRNTPDYVVDDRRRLVEKVKHDHLEMGEGLIGFVAKTGESLLISNALSDPRIPQTPADFLQIQSIMVAPLRTRQRIIGVLALVNKKHGGKFNEQDLYLLEQLSTQASLTVDIVRLYQLQAGQRRIEQELQIAKEFQQMLLPHELPHLEGWDIAAFSKPALEVGGDYYDIFWVEPGALLGITIVDVAGKGIRGALVMAIFRSLLKAEAAGRNSPKEVLTRVNTRILEDTQNKVFVTAIYAILDVRTLTMKVARAGHEPLLICNAKNPEARVCQPGGIAIGLVDSAMFGVLEECEVPLEKGDTIVLYTDGVIEASDREGNVFGAERFSANLQKRLDRSAEELVHAVMDDISVYAATMPQQDDITLIALKYQDTERNP
ncbi:TPA: hypothetical protein DDW35_02185 [Candidatus Sumerlaeota bacterium]|nr:hypothetical protein [Candidatus Sumerlaeota bacterium]